MRIKFCCITPNFPCKSGWKTPLKEQLLYLQLEKLKMLLRTFWHWLKFPVPLWVNITGACGGRSSDTQGLSYTAE